MTYWVSWWVLEDGFEEPPWKYWWSGYRDGCGDNDSEEASACALIEAESEEAVWEEVGKYFKDIEQRFCDERPGLTYEELAKDGRFV